MTLHADTLEMAGELRARLGTGTINSFGLPGAGKDTQLERLAGLWGITHISSGAIFRQKGVLNPTDQEILDSGVIVPTRLFDQLVVPVLSAPERADEPLLLSSVGKKLKEAKTVLYETERAGHPTRAVLHLVIDEETSLARAYARKEQRGDDAEGVPEKRLQEYMEQTTPVLDFYEGEGLLVHIDAMAEETVVFGAMVTALHERIAA